MICTYFSPYCDTVQFIVKMSNTNGPPEEENTIYCALYAPGMLLRRPGDGPERLADFRRPPRATMRGGPEEPPGFVDAREGAQSRRADPVRPPGSFRTPPEHRVFGGRHLVHPSYRRGEGKLVQPLRLLFRQIGYFFHDRDEVIQGLL